MTDPERARHLAALDRQQSDAAARLAALHRQKLREAAVFGLCTFGTIATYTAGPPRSVTVTIRDPNNPVTAQWIANSYTPAVGDRVLCAWVDNQLAVIGAGG